MTSQPTSDFLSGRQWRTDRQGYATVVQSDKDSVFFFFDSFSILGEKCGHDPER